MIDVRAPDSDRDGFGRPLETRAAVWRIGPDLRVRGAPLFEQLLGLEPGAAPTLSDLLLCVPAPERAGLAETVQRALAQQQSFAAEVAFEPPGAQARRLWIEADPIPDASGRVIAMVGTVASDEPPVRGAAKVETGFASATRTDKDPERGAAKVETGFTAADALAVLPDARGLIRQSIAPMALIGPDRRFVLASAALDTLLGGRAGGLEGETVEAVLSWAPERWRRAVERGLLGETTRFEADPVTLPDGSLRCLRWSVGPWTAAGGETVGACLMALDVTELVDARAALETSRMRMEFGLDMSDMLICEFDLEHHTQASEGDWKQFFPSPPSLAVITGEDTAVPAADREVLAGQWVAHLGGAPPYAVQYRVQMGDGREIWHAASVRILRAAGGAASRVMAVVQNITEQKRSEAQLRAAEHRARVAAAAKGDFLANISHEIRTPLNGVIAVSEMLQRTQLDERQQEMVRLVAGSGEVLLKVIDDILDYTRIDAEAVELENRPFDLEATLRSACEAAGHRAEAKGLEFECFLSAALDGVFRGDPVRIGQIVGQLLGNAVKFTDSGGVTFSAAASEAVGHTDVTLTITDTGAGFAAGFAERMFDRFEQEDASTSRRFGGLGLGLSIVKRLVDLMGGRISARSELGQGATFEVVLPLARDRIAALGSPRVVPVEGLDAEICLDRLRVLAAEDNPMNRRVLELLTAPNGMVLQFAENGREAVNRFASGTFDLVLMDLQMPVMDGLAATRTIRAFEVSQGRPPTPILALSANASDGHVREALAAGADGHVAKPIVRETLFEAIGRHARRPASSDADIDLDELDLAV